MEVKEGAATISLATRLENRVIDFGTLSNQAFSGSPTGFARCLGNTFISIPLPGSKFTAAVSGGGSNVFKTRYFNNDAYLAQGPQLHKQMVICADFERGFRGRPSF